MNKAGMTVFEGQTPTVVNLKTSAGGYFDPEKYTVVASKDGFVTQRKLLTGKSVVGIS